MPLDTKAGAWPLIAVTVYKASCIARTDAAIRWHYVNQERPGAIPDDLRLFTSRAVADLFRVELVEEFGARADDLEKLANGLVRMRLMARENPVYLSLLDLSWDSAITIARWALNDPGGAEQEIQRYLAGSPERGPGATKLRYRAAMKVIPKEQRRTMDTGKARRGRPKEWQAASRYRLALGQFTRNDWAELSPLLRDFQAMSADDLVDHALAAQLPALAFANDHQALAMISLAFAETGARSAALRSAASLMADRMMIREPASQTLLAEIAALSPQEPLATHYRQRFDTIPLIHKGRPVAKHQAVRLSHPRWRRLSEWECARRGYEFARRDMNLWVKTLNEVGDPTHHPLNFVSYCLRTGRSMPLMIADAEAT